VQENVADPAVRRCAYKKKRVIATGTNRVIQPEDQEQHAVGPAGGSKARCVPAGMSCYPPGGTGARPTLAVPSGNVTVQVTAFVARPVFWPHVLATTVTPSVVVKVSDSRTMCWSSIHRLAESPTVPTTVISPSSHTTVNVSRPYPGGASATAGNTGNATAAAVNAPSARSRFMCFPFDEVAVGIDYPARNVIQSRA
jgi:hypothetical protein